EHVEAVFERDLVEQGPFGQAARRARDASRRGRLRDREAGLVGQIDLEAPGPAPFGERPRARAGAVAVATDAQAQVHAVRLVPQVQQQIPHGQGVLAPGDRDQHPLTGADHAVLADRPAHLLPAALHEAAGAVGGTGVPHLDGGLLLATMALHRVAQPPEITGRASTVSPCARRPSTVTRSAPRMGSTDSGLSPSCLHRSLARSGPGTSTSRVGLWSWIFIVVDLGASRRPTPPV